MAFTKTGVVTAPKIVPSYGLLDVAKPENGPSEDQWIRGFSQEWDSEISSIVNLDDTNSSESEVYVAASAVTRYNQIKPFFVEVEDTHSGLGFLAVDRFARIERQLDAATQKAMEAELWDGAVRKDAEHENRALTSESATILNSGTALSPRRALALLEFEMGSVSPAGENGVIHMTRDVFSLLSTAGGDVFMFNEDKKRVETTNGTPVIIGAGYSGTGPDEASNATASATNKWIYGTGVVKTYLGDIDVVNDNLSQAYDVSGNANDMRIKAIRPAAVYFDTSIHLAVRVDLTA